MDPGSGEIERLFTPHFARGRGGERPRAIVVHTTAGSFAGTADWFADPESGVSAHYLVGLDGRIAQFVDETDAARHAGRVLRPTASIAQGRDDLNPVTIGIELEDGGDAEHVERPDAQYAAAATLIAAAGERWEIPIDREHVIGHREAFAAKACPGNVDLERLVALAGSSPRGAAKHAREQALLCLLPIRDGAEDLPGYLSSTEALSADVLALDDGSADGSAQVLRSHPRVIEVLRPEAGTPTWDDAANRQALLGRAAATDYDWLLFLDSDERVDPDDAAALRQFLATDAIPGLAYGLQLHRAWGERVDPNPRYVYRLFARAAEMTLPAERLHLNPVPLEVSRRAWVRTSIRVRHLESAERLDRRRAKYDRADPDGAHRAHTETMLAPPPEHLVEWPPRPAGLAVVGGAKAPPAGGREAADASRPLLLCLLAVRNGAADLEGYLESAERFADAVVALDDGSTDATAELLAEAPLVRKLIRNPRRDSYAGWDDAANRQALLDAASALEPLWVVFVDADERIDPDDAAALRGFAARDAIPGDAYGFRVHRMIGTLDRYDRADLWAYRMFAHEPGMRLPAETLHLVPVPDSIPRARWRSTTVRIQHLAGLDEARRRERLRKYEEADPGRVWQRDYERILETEPVRPWVPRPPGLPVLLAGRHRARMSGDDLDLEAPRLSAIVISHNDEARIERAVRSVVEQRCDEPFEVIVVVSGTDRTAAVVAATFPEVTLIDLGKRALPGRARNAGVRAARGDYVSFPGSHVELPPGSLAARIAAHEAGWPMVTGSILNGTETRSGWASYFLDHSSSLPGRPSGELAAAPAHCSYVRQFVVEAGGFPDDVRAGEDTVLNQALWSRGHRAYRAREITLVHRSPCTNPLRLVRHHFIRGRALARIVRERDDGRPPRGRPRFLRSYSRRRLAATDRRVADWGGDLRPRYEAARRLVQLGIAAAHAGAAFEWRFGRSARGRGRQQLADRDRSQAEVAQPLDDRGQGLEGGPAVGAIVKEDDRSP